MRNGLLKCILSVPTANSLTEPVLDGEILDKDDEPIRQQEPTPSLPDIGAIINNALRAAGLIKD